jgi:hypothetical protein
MVAVQASDGATEDTQNENVETGALHRHSARSVPTWKIHLGTAVTRANNCRVLVGRGYLTIVGCPSDSDNARFIFAHVAEEIDRLTLRESRLLGKPGRTYLNNFRLGCVEAVKERLQEATREARAEAKQRADQSDTLGNGAALVLVNRAIERIDQRKKLADGWVQKHCKGKKVIASTRYDAMGRDAGRRAGQNIDLGGQRPGLSRGENRQLQS